MWWKLSPAAAGPGSRRPVSFAGQETQLRIPEGVLLGHALVARVADSLGVRVFFIKGPASVIQGLRRAKVSVDVDVFVAPSDLVPLMQALQSRGWRERPSGPDNRSFPKHSITIDNPGWPCCIDVHFRFPGMEEPAANCYETMWANTSVLAVAGQLVRVPSKPMGILILALHALRSPHLPAYRQELKFLKDFTRQHSYTSAVMEIAMATGSLAAVRPFLEEVLEEGPLQEWPEPSREWRNHLSAREPGSARLITILQAPLLDKPLLVWESLFPPRKVSQSGNVQAQTTFLGRLAQHRARWMQVLQGLPRTAQDIRRL